jgi:hypothetical protein
MTNCTPQQALVATQDELRQLVSNGEFSGNLGVFRLSWRFINPLAEGRGCARSGAPYFKRTPQDVEIHFITTVLSG